MTDMLFPLFWMLIGVLLAVSQANWAIRDLRAGVATYYFRYEITRDVRPIGFWMLIARRILGAVAGILMFSFGLFLLGIFNA